MSDVEDGRLEQEVLRFVALLREVGIAAGSGQAQDAIRALGLVDLRSQGAVYAALRTVLLDAHAHEPLFRAAFSTFWRSIRPLPPFPMQPPQTSEHELDRERTPHRAPNTTGATAGDPESDAAGSLADSDGVGGPADTDPMLAYSASETLQHKDFADLTPDELVHIRRLLASLTLAPMPRRARRTRRSTSGPMLDLRHTVRRNLRHGGEVIVLPRRRRVIRPRPLVLLCDISGSMDRYTRMLLCFLHAASQRSTTIESFVFGTRLTRITRQLRRRDPDAALDQVQGQVLDFSGGTRIGEAIAVFNRRWARRVLRGGAVVVIISDGWDRGDPAQLAAEMAHLHRLCHQLIWLNPLLGMEEYQPLTRGMAAALPHVDLFLPAHNLASLRSLAEMLSNLDVDRQGLVAGAAS